MKNAIEALLDRWRVWEPGRTIDIANEMSKLALDVLVRTIFTEGLGERHDVVLKNMRLYFDSFGRIDALDFLGLPAFLPRSAKRRAQPAEAFFDDAVARLLGDRKAQLARNPAGVPQDLLTLLIGASERGDCGEGLSPAALRANVITFIAAGHETTANALSWSLYLLSRSEAWRERVIAEGAPAHDGDVAEFVNARAVVDEAVRLYPPIVAISRQALGSDELAGVPVTNGTMVVVAPYVLHRHELLWQRPEMFDPGRFLPEARGSIRRFAYLPFGVGPRICIGAAFALQEMTMAVAAITAHFRLEPDPEHRVWPLQRMTLRPQGGLPMRIWPRQAA